MGRRGAAGSLSRGQPPAPLGCIPKPGETWLPIGRKALVGAAHLGLSLVSTHSTRSSNEIGKPCLRAAASRSSTGTQPPG